MNNDSNEETSQSTNTSKQDVNASNEGSWSILADNQKYGSLGFLQLCIEKRFHRAIQQKFEEITGLQPTEYWIHADVGGSPGMEDRNEAPDHCRREGAKVMGWSAHGSKCGGFPGRPDDYIRGLLLETLRKKAERYREITHHAFFAVETDIPEEIRVWHLTLKAGDKTEQ